MTTPGTIVPADAQDAGFIHKITSTADNFSTDEVIVSDELFEEYLLRGAEASGYYFLVYREDGQTLGYVCYGPRALTQGTYDLYWIATDKAHHKRGIGLAMLRCVETELRNIGGRLLVIETSGKDDYSAVRRFYINVGCTLAATIRDFYSPGDDLQIFVRYL